MEYGVHLPHLGSSAGRAPLLEWAQEAERLGAHSLWASDHIAWPRDVDSDYPYTEDGSFPPGFDMPWLEPLGSLMFVAAVTERVRLGTSVLILGYRPTVLTAKMVATLDVLSAGRTILGVGVGWMKEEFDVLGMPFDRRGARADECLETFKALFEQESPAFAGTFHQFPEIGFSPKPVQSPVPVWVGGSSWPAFMRTARYGDGFHAAFEPLDVVRSEWEDIGRACEQLGRDRSEIELSIRLYLDPHGRMPAEKSVHGSHNQMAEIVGQWSDIGVDHILLDVVAPGGAAGRLDVFRDFMTSVAG